MKKSILYFVMVLGFSIVMISCSTDSYDVENQSNELEVISPLMNKDGDGTVEDGGTDEAAGDSTDPIVKPKKD